MRYAYLLVLLLVLLVPFGAAHGEPVCPPTDTGSPTDTPAPPPAEPTPSSPPEETAPPPPEWTGTPWLQTQYPSITPGTPAPDPMPSETAGVSPVPGKEKHPKPTVIETLPVTGAGDSMSLGMVAVLGVVFLGIAFVARMVRRVG